MIYWGVRSIRAVHLCILIFPTIDCLRYGTVRVCPAGRHTALD